MLFDVMGGLDFLNRGEVDWEDKWEELEIMERGEEEETLINM